jgi:arylsulfatase
MRALWRFPEYGVERTVRRVASKVRHETFDEVLVENTKSFIDNAKKDGKPFFIWHNTTRMHVFTYIPPKYQALMN